MRKFLVLCALVLLPLASARAEQVPQEQRTLFYYAERAWAVGTIQLSAPLRFRDGKVIAFPSTIADLVWAPKGAKPRNLMLVYEVASTDDPKNPHFKEHDEIFAPIQLLPEHAYWKDNLPNTRRHAIAGGRRYAFRGDDIAEVRAAVSAYLAASAMTTPDRPKRQIDAVASALVSKNTVLREEAARFLSHFPSLATNFSEQALAPLASYLASDAPADEKSKLVDALVAAKVTAIKPEMTRLAARDDATGAIALKALTAFGEAPPVARLLELSRSKSVEMRAWAAGELAARAGTDGAAASATKEILTNPKEDVRVLQSATAGLARSGGDGPAVGLLGEALRSGEAASRPAADALAVIGNPAAVQVLADTLKSSKGEAAYAAVAGLFRTHGCPTCVPLLEEQHESHPDEEVRKLIGVMLEVPMEHKH